MAGSTPFYHLGFFDFGDKLDSAINVRREVDRFMLIDKQLYGLYQIFGDGVITGWDVFDNGFSTTTGISIGISNGSGVLNSIAIDTQFPEFIVGVSPSSTFDVYAILTGETVDDRKINFVTATTGTVPGGSVLKMATVVAGATGITSIDNTVKSYISFQSVIMDAVDNHKHRGVPSKIDLENDVKNQLPNARIGNIESSKITSGRVNKNNIPVLDHTGLKNIGILSHAALDSFVQSITVPNLGLLGEVASVNLLRQTVFIKYIYPTVDHYFVNELAVLPGVSSDSQIDFTGSTAIIDLAAGCVAGFPFANTDAYFFTENFELPELITRGILTARANEPHNSIVTFGINTTNSLDFDDYEEITEDKVFVLDQPGYNLRVGIKLTSTSGHHDPYIVNFDNFVDFVFVNESSSARTFHFRIRFYNDIFLTDLFLTKYSGNNQEGWIIDDKEEIPAAGYEVNAGDSITVTFYPDQSLFVSGKTYYLIIDAFDGSSFTSESSGYTFVSGGSSTCDQYSNVPTVKNFAMIFELENGGKIMLNI